MAANDKGDERKKTDKEKKEPFITIVLEWEPFTGATGSRKFPNCRFANIGLLS